MITHEKAIENLDKVITQVEFSRLQVSDHCIVQLVAVSKYSTVEEIKILYKAGQRAFGENKVQDLKDKSIALDDTPLSWHFIGSLQKNKINNLIDLNPTLMHSLDSLDLAQELDKKLKAKGINLGYFGVNQYLKRIGAETTDLRNNFKRNWSGPGRLASDIKLSAVKRVLEERESVSHLAKELGVARKTIYKWIDRYNNATQDGIIGSKALKENSRNARLPR